MKPVHIKLSCWRKNERHLNLTFGPVCPKKVEDTPSCVEKRIDDSGAQIKAGSIVEMEKADEFETNEFVMNDYKN